MCVNGLLEFMPSVVGIVRSLHAVHVRTFRVPRLCPSRHRGAARANGPPVLLGERTGGQDRDEKEKANTHTLFTEAESAKAMWRRSIVHYIGAMPRIAVFCGASVGHDPVYAEVAAQVGRAIVGRGFSVVYGGGHVGLMGILADAAMMAGGEVIGVIPRFMEKTEEAHRGVTELILVDSMHERKLKMHQLSNGVIALPGGFGTLDELFELLTWRQLKLHAQPLGLLNVKGFFDPLIAQQERMAQEGFLHGDTRLIAEASIGPLLARIVEGMSARED